VEGGVRLQHPSNQNFKNMNVVDEMMLKVLHDLRFSLNQPLKSADN
jgi:hypothetical protein